MKKFVTGLLVSLALVAGLIGAPTNAVAAPVVPTAYPQTVKTRATIGKPNKKMVVRKSRYVKVAIKNTSTAVSGKPYGKVKITIKMRGRATKTIVKSNYKGQSLKIRLAKPLWTGYVTVKVSFTPASGSVWMKSAATKKLRVRLR